MADLVTAPAVPAITLTRPAAGRAGRASRAGRAASAGRRPRRRVAVRVPRLARRVVGPLAVIGLWQLVCSLGVFSSVEVASPVAVLQAGRQLWDQGVLQSNLLISLERVVEGLALGVIAGVALAVVCGLFWAGEDLLDPVIQAARAVPILGLVPLAIIWFGVGETPKVFLIALGCTFPVYINTYAGIRGVDSGLGYLINQAQTTDRTDIMFLCLAIYAVLGVLADAIVRLLERTLLRWRRGFAGA